MRGRLCGLLLGLLAEGASAEAAVSDCRTGSQRMARVELFFGAGRTLGRQQKAWRDFVARVVTPRFPDGLTVVDAAGQWRGAHGLEREASRMMIIIYRPDGDSDAKIEAIRSVYKARFKQQSVLRVDTTACVAF